MLLHYIVCSNIILVALFISPALSATSLFKNVDEIQNRAGQYLFSRNAKDEEFEQSTKTIDSIASGTTKNQLNDEKIRVFENDMELLKHPQERFRSKRSAKRQQPVDLYKPSDLQDPNLHLVVHWAGFNSSVMVILTKNITTSSKVVSSNIYFSYDYGKNFTRKMQSPDQFKSSNLSRSLIRALISNFYSTQLDIKRYIFTDVSTRTLYTTIDSGRTINRHSSLLFSPDLISIHPSNPSVVLCLDKTSSRKGLYKSDDFGVSWRMIQTNVKNFHWGYSGNNHYDKENSLYVERNEPSGTIAVLRSETYFTHDTYDQVLISNVEDFLVMNNSLFATRRTGRTRELWIAITRRSRFARANFHTTLPKNEFFVVDASDMQIMVCVKHSSTMTHLYISEPNEIDFVLSLQNITYYNPQTSTSFLSLYASQRFADIHKVSGMRSIFIANIINTSRSRGLDFGPANLHTVITFDKGGMWERLPAPEQNGRTANCSARDGCSLHLTQQYHHNFPRTSTSLILSQPSAPGYILAQGNVGSKIKYETNLYFSSTAGTEWTEVLSGSWMYTWGDHGGIIVALLKFEKTNTLWYSTNQGELWNTFKFSNETIRVYGLMTEPGESSTIFTLFGSSNHGTHSWLLIQVNFSNIFSGVCDDSDYKPWSPADERGITCLLGSQTTFERRTKHSVCFNGRNYDRPTTVKSCPCTREDFECDVGYSSFIFGFYCVPNPDTTSSIDLVPPTCQAGAFYNRTKGYRKLAGDRCSGGTAESHYAPDQVPCPVVEENAFMLVSTNFGLYRIDMVNNDSAIINPSVTGAVDLDFSFKLNTLFWANNTALYLTNLNSSITSKLFQHERAISHLSLDWFSSNVYWTDTSGYLYVTNMNESTRQLAVNCTSVNEVTTVPVKGVLYIICSRNNVVLSQLHLDGGNMTTVRTLGHSSTNLNQQVGLTYDTNTDRLYWIFNGGLKSCFRDGTGYRNLVNPNGEVLHQLSTFKSDIYWLSKRFPYFGHTTVKYANKYQYSTEHAFTQAPPSYRTITSMKIFVHHSQLTSVTNPCIGRKCSQLCVPVPSTKALVGQCLCGNARDLIIEYGPSGNERCTCPSGEIYNSSLGYCQATNHTCPADHFLCSNRKCILAIWKCDQESDCADGSDEVDCPVSRCRDDQFECNSSNRCIPHRWRCDYDRDCSDGSDEQGCNYPTCSPQQHTCANGRCIDRGYLCDGDNDCRDWSDEKGCQNKTSNVTNKCDPEFQFFCARPSGFWASNCMPKYWVCDGTEDCQDGSDERNCSHPNSTTAPSCEFFQRPCANGICMYEWDWCDGERDCPDGSDEANCSTRAPTTPTTHTSAPIRPSNKSCGGSDLKCAHTGNCYPLQWRCDGVDDCGDSSDEFDCPVNATTAPSFTLPCISLDFQFRCANGKCIFQHYKCDLDNDCGDWSDERNCANFPRKDDGCLEGYGINYRGTRSYTKTGRTCQRWDRNYPHKPHYWPEDPHHNYCRDPDNDKTGPWCYTTDPNKRWDFCGIPHCSTHPASPAPPTADPTFCSDGFLDCGPGTSPRCIFERFACDGEPDCSNGADEANCNASCTGNEFRCANSRCIAASLRCNYHDDCSDNSDESNCTSYHYSCTNPGAFICTSTSLCIPSWKRCDGHGDCSDKSDEKNCKVPSSTPAPSFKCDSGKVIPLQKRCNYKLDCKDESDETNCNYIATVVRGSCTNSNRSLTCMSLTFVPQQKARPTGYIVYYAPKTPTTRFSVKNSRHFWSKAPSFKLTNLYYNQRYDFGIAYNYSNYTLPLGLKSTFMTPATFPDPPRIKNVRQIGPGSIEIEWQLNKHPKSSVTGYEVQYYSANGLPLTTRADGNVDYVVLNSLSVLQYFYRVRAMSNLGFGSWSSIRNFTIRYGVATYTSPPNVTKLSANSATIKWKPVNNVMKYRVEALSSYASFYEQDKSVLSNITSLILSKLAPGENYQARVTPVYSGNHLGPSSSFSFFTTKGTKENTPIIQKASKALSTTSVQLYWSPVKSKTSKSLIYWVQYGAGESELEAPLIVRNNSTTVVSKLPKNQLQLFRVSVHSPYIGRWSPFFPLSPLPDYSDAPRELSVSVAKPFKSALACWVSSYIKVNSVLFYQVTVVNEQTKKVVIDEPGTHRHTFFSTNRHICFNITQLKRSAVYTVTVKDIYKGVPGSPSRLTFLNEVKIPPIQSVKVVPIRGTNDYDLSFSVHASGKAFYNKVLRDILITLCTGKDVPSSNNTSCSSYDKIPPGTYSYLLSNLKQNQWYTLFLTLQCSSKLDCSTRPTVISFQGGVGGSIATSSSKNQSLDQTSVIAIAVSAATVLICLLLVIVFLVRRNRRLRHSYSSFVSSHYNPQSGEAIFVDDVDGFDNGLDDEGEADTPLIGGFADDEPLIVA